LGVYIRIGQERNEQLVMINEHSEQPITGMGPKRIVVRARHRRKQWITLPISREAAALEAAEQEAAKKRFEGTTPQGRDIIRKVTATVRQKLFGTSGRASAAAPAQAPQSPSVALVSSGNSPTPKSGESSSAPDQLGHLVSLQQTSTIVDTDGPHNEQQARKLGPSGEVNQPEEPDVILETLELVTSVVNRLARFDKLDFILVHRVHLTELEERLNRQEHPPATSLTSRSFQSSW
jgi:hypothetical protein